MEMTSPSDEAYMDSLFELETLGRGRGKQLGEEELITLWRLSPRDLADDTKARLRLRMAIVIDYRCARRQLP